MADEAGLAVEASVGWHDSWMRAFGLRTETDADAWCLLDPPPQPWYFTAITRRPDAPPDALASATGTVCDAWSRLDLEPLGFERRDAEPWYFRPAGPLATEAMPSELEIVRAATPEAIEEFEAVSVRGFEIEDASIEVGGAHPASILVDPRMTSWIGRVDGRAVAAAMSYRTDGAIGVFGVTTLPSARKRGYGTAMTRAAMLVDSVLPSVLSPSPEGENLYRRLGFRPVGELQTWWRS
jgi:ribosomal protein S18 acetylase RimI-like enzyme